VPTLGLGGVLVYGINALPAFGDANAPAMLHISPVYAQQSVADMATPNVVAAVLADYRSLDTLMEAAVVVAAVLACLLILMHRDDPVV
jgi:multicomponent Na+:H+ antiporter subunit B